MDEKYDLSTMSKIGDDLILGMENAITHIRRQGDIEESIKKIERCSNKYLEALGDELDIKDELKFADLIKTANKLCVACERLLHLVLPEELETRVYLIQKDENNEPISYFF